MSIKGFIFDLDGVICFTDEYHYLAWKEMANGMGVYFDREINNKTKGSSGVTKLSTDNSKVQIYMIPTNEEYMIAIDTQRLAAK